MWHLGTEAVEHVTLPSKTLFCITCIFYHITKYVDCKEYNLNHFSGRHKKLG